MSRRIFVSNIKTGRNTNTDYFAGKPGPLEITVYFTKVSSIVVTAHARQASLETVLIHYADQEVSSVTGVNVNRLDTYNVAVKELNLFYHEIDVLEQFAKLQTSLSRSL